MTEQMIIDLIKNSAVAGDNDMVLTLVDQLHELRYPTVEKKTRAKANKTGYVQLTMDGAFVAKFDTVKEANIAVEKKETASCIPAACKNFQSGKSNVAYGYRWVYGSDYTE